MAKKWLVVLAAIVGIVIGFVFVNYLWPQLRPDDDEMTKIGVGAITAFATFISVYFMTKGSGD